MQTSGCLDVRSGVGLSVYVRARASGGNAYRLACYVHELGADGRDDDAGHSCAVFCLRERETSCACCARQCGGRPPHEPVA